MVARIAEPLMAGVALGQLRRDELAGAVLDDLGLEAALQIVEDLLVAPAVARLEDRRADRHVGARLAQTLLDRARRLADLEADIPQRIEHVLDDLLGMWRNLVGQEEEQIDVGMRRQLAAAIGADRDDGEMLAGGWVGQWIDMGDGEIVQRADQLIHQETMLAHRLGAMRAGFEAPADLVIAALERRLEQGDDRHPIAGGDVLSPGERSQRLAEGTAVDDLALSGDESHSGPRWLRQHHIPI